MADYFDQFELVDPSLVAGGPSPGSYTPGGDAGTPPPTAPPAPGAPPATGGTSPDDFGRAWLASGGKTVDDLNRFIAANPQYGAKAFGSKGDKVIFPNGQGFDAVQSAGEGGGIAGTWSDITNAGDGGGSSGTLGGLGSGSLIAPWNKQFKAPNPNQIAKNPYYQFQMQQGLQGIERGAAAKGTLLTGGTLKALDRYGQGVASAFGDQAYDRGMQEYLLKRENFYASQDRPYTKLKGLAELGKPSA